MSAAFARIIKKKFVAAEAVRNSEDGLLVTEGKGSNSAAIGSTSSAGRYDTERLSNQPLVQETPIAKVEESPPAYTQAGGSSSTLDSRRWNETALDFEQRKLRERKELLAADPSTMTESRAYNETEVEYEQRRLKERKELLLEKIRIAREEDDLRARMRARGP